jgi:hypothetical protein
MTTQNSVDGTATADLDVMAIRALMEKERPCEREPLHSISRKSGQEPPHQRSSKPKAAEPQGEADAEMVRSRPTKRSVFRPRHAALLALVALVALRPGLVIAFLALLCAPLVLFFIYLCFVGVDGFWYRTRSFYLRIKSRNPALAKRMRTGFYAGAERWDAVMDRLPGTLPEKAYAPDFQAAHAAEVAHQRALEQRFNRLREEMSA